MPNELEDPDTSASADEVPSTHVEESADIPLEESLADGVDVTPTDSDDASVPSDESADDDDVDLGVDEEGDGETPDWKLDTDTSAGNDSQEEVREIVTEALGSRLSRRAVLTASGLAVALAVGAGAIGVATSGTPHAVFLDSSSVSSTDTEVAPRDASGVAAEASQSVFRIKAGTQTGSSWLLEDDTLVTNAHVAAVDVGETLSVTSPAGKTFKGKVLTKDTSLDVALVQVPKQSADPLPLVGVKDQKVGQPVVLAGYPLDLKLTVTSGIASAIDTATDLRESPAQHSLLQVDAAVNPGSSGGPVLDSRGRVMGMVTSRPDSVGDRQVEGISFAIPANDIQVAIQQYNDHGDVEYGYLGVSLTDGAGGAKVKTVSSGSPADSVGITEGDTITSVGGYQASSYTSVSRYLHMYRPGEKVSLTVKSGKKTKDIDVVLGEPSE